MNNNLNENKIPFYKFQNNFNYKQDNPKHLLEKNNSAPNIHLHNADVNSTNVRKKFFLNNTKNNKLKNSTINAKESGIKYLLKENLDKNSLAEKEKTLYSKSNYKRFKLPFYLSNNNKNFSEKLKVNLNTNTINEQLIAKIKQKNLAEFNKFVSIKQDEMENLKLKVKHKKKIKSCDSRKISPNKKLQKKFSKITTCNTLDKELNNNNSTFNVIFKNLNNEKGERNYYLKNMILHNKQNDQNINIINNIQMDKSNINNSRKINLNNLSGKIYLESYNKVMTKKSS